MGARQAAHRDSMRTVTGFPRRRPCTKGVANASSAQAP
jgi:tRNA U34 5-methylaminomethyl-2-thiouridine-forming methyltransferase MnmC